MGWVNYFWITKANKLMAKLGELVRTSLGKRIWKH